MIDFRGLSIPMYSRMGILKRSGMSELLMKRSLRVTAEALIWMSSWSSLGVGMSVSRSSSTSAGPYLGQKTAFIFPSCMSCLRGLTADGAGRGGESQERGKPSRWQRELHFALSAALEGRETWLIGRSVRIKIGFCVYIEVTPWAPYLPATFSIVLTIGLILRSFDLPGML